jgi:high-affinity nickel-transport protein
MSLVDSTEGVAMLAAYGWAYVRPARKFYYNLNITLLSVVVAVFIGGAEALAAIGRPVSAIFSFANLGYGLLALCAITLCASVVIGIHHRRTQC